MKPTTLRQFLPSALFRLRLFRRPVGGAEPSRPAPARPRPREPARYIPMMMGSQIMPFIIDTHDPGRPRDPYA